MQREQTPQRSKPIVGIIGNGFVGDAVAQGFEQHLEVLRYDTDPDRSHATLDEVAKRCEFIFVCVPTPTDLHTGTINLDCVSDVLTELAARQSNATIVIKSTMVPGSMEQFAEDFSGLTLVYNPEFLTERTAVKDFQNLTRVVLGGEWAWATDVADLYRLYINPQVEIVRTDYATAQLIKYACNCFFAVKIAFFNELHQLCEALDCDFDTVKVGMLLSRWVNPMHTNVPGPDGNFGFGGKCFPKDLCALIAKAYELGVPPRLLEAAWFKNLEVRPERDWEMIEGAMV